MSARPIDGRLLLKVASQLENLQARVAELENGQRIHAQTIARHAEALEIIRQTLNDENENEEAATLQ